MPDKPSAVVTTHYRYKRPPRKRKAVALDVPAIERQHDNCPDHPEPAITTASRKRAKPLRAERARDANTDPAAEDWVRADAEAGAGQARAEAQAAQDAAEALRRPPAAEALRRPPDGGAAGEGRLRRVLAARLGE